MNGKDSSDDTKPCWEGVALGWRKDIPDSLRLRPRAGESFHPRCRGDHSLVLQSEEEPASLSSVRSDSGLNSMEFWDYTVELECIQGQQDSTEVAELGKNLIVKNRELDELARFQQDTIQDQTMRIEHLCRQTAMLREMTDSRMKVYEQLEVAVSTLEETNTNLVEETAADKNRIRMLVENTKSLEGRCEELQRCLEGSKQAKETGRVLEETVNMEVEEEMKRKESAKQIQRSRERKATEERELLMELAMSRMSDKVVLLEQENRESRCLVKEMEEQVSRLVEENRILREETSEGKEEEHFSMKDELADNILSGSVCQCGNTTKDAFEDVATAGQEDGQDEVIAQLGMQYRALIEKYEELLDLFNQTKKQQSSAQPTQSQMSLQEELSRSDYMIDMVDVMNISHGVSLNISYEVTADFIDKKQFGQEYRLDEEELIGKHTKNKIQCVGNDNAESQTSNTKNKRKLDTEELISEHQAVKGRRYSISEIDNVDDVIQNQETLDASNFKLGGEVKKHPIENLITNNHDMSNVTLFSKFYSFKDEFMHKDKTVKIQKIHENIKKVDKNNINKYEIKHIILNTKDNILPENLNFDIKLHNDLTHDDIDSDDVLDELKQEYEFEKELTYELTTIETLENTRNEIKHFNHREEFLSEEDYSVSSGFSEEIMEVMKIDQDCQTDLVFPEENVLENNVSKKVQTIYLKGIENYQTIFCKMFALLKSENHTL